MEKNYPKKGKPSDGEERGFNREDAGRNDDKPFAEFAKDKRKRITRVEKTEPKRKEEGTGDRSGRGDFNRSEGFRPERPERDARDNRDARDSRDGRDNRDARPKQREDQPRKPYSGSGERHSYNPNFTKDNKLRKDGNSDRSYPDRDGRDSRYGRQGSGEGGGRYGQRDSNRSDEPRQRDFNRSDDSPQRDFNRTDEPRRRDYDRGEGSRERYGSGSRDPRNDREGRPAKYNPQGGKPRYEKPQGDYGKPQGRYDKPYSDKPYSDKPRYDKPYSDKPYGDKPRYDKPYNDKPRYDKPYSDKPRYDKPYSDKPRYDRPYSDRPYSDKPHYDKSAGGRGAKQASKAQTQGRYKDGSYPTFPAPAIEDEIRLNRYIAAAGKSSRREADDLIRDGRVTVNGVAVTEMGSKIKAGDIVQVDGETIRSEKKVYILMNKPKGFVTTLEDPFAEKTVMDLLRNACSERVYPVGRLDKNSLGVLLVTNDGDLTTHLTHPSFNKKKIYQVTLDKPLTRADMQQIIDGIALEDGEIQADEVNYVDETKKEVGIEIHSGRNRVVRRIFEHLGYRVTKLDRVYFAGLTKKNLKRGQWRFLTPKEVDILKSGRYE